MRGARHFAALAAGALAFVAAAFAWNSDARPAREDPRPGDGVPPLPSVQGASIGADATGELRATHSATSAARDRALTFLALQQAAQQDGSFGRGGGEQHAPVALAALGGLAFMASGSTPDRGPWGRQVALAIDYLLGHADMAPSSAARGYIAVSREDKWGMHAHGYATLALAQAYAISPGTPRGQRIAEVLDAAVRVIETSQTAEGGWFYFPEAGLSHENSVTVVELQALRAARDCGVHVDARVIDKAVRYIGRCQSEDGMFRYALDATQKTSLALTAAGLNTLQNAGQYEGREVDKALEALWRELVAREDGRERALNFPEYERLYVALALWTAPDTRMYRRWADPEREHLIASQRADGSWSEEQFGACYATSMNCLFLSLEDGLLPLFQR